MIDWSPADLERLFSSLRASFSSKDARVLDITAKRTYLAKVRRVL